MIALIPARGGSKGLPHKNEKILCNKPLIAYTIEAAQKASEITRVIISTDSENIAKIAQEYGAEVPFLRPEYLATDESKAIDVYLHTIEWIEKTSGIIESICILLPTCPLRTSEDIDNAIKLFKSKKAESVIAFTKEDHPIVWHKYINEDLKFENIFPDTINNRQNERVSFFPNGSIYVFNTSLLKNRKYYSDKSYAYIMPKKRSIDIDNIDDFMYAEFILLNQKSTKYE